MKLRAYKLQVSGVVQYGEEDNHIANLLLEKEQTSAQIQVALRELEEEATSLKVEMLPLEP